MECGHKPQSSFSILCPICKAEADHVKQWDKELKSLEAVAQYYNVKEVDQNR